MSFTIKAESRVKRSRKVIKNTIVYHEGAIARRGYRVESGAILLVVTRDDKDVAFAIVTVGETFGEEFLAEIKRRRHTAIALQDSSVTTLDESHTRKIMRDTIRRLEWLELMWSTDRGEERVRFVLSSYSNLYLKGATIAALTS